MPMHTYNYMTYNSKGASEPARDKSKSKMRGCVNFLQLYLTSLDPERVHNTEELQPLHSSAQSPFIDYS